MKSTWVIVIASAAFLICMFSGAGLAQTASTGAIAGATTDSSQAVVPGVEIIVRNEATGERRTVISRENIRRIVR